MLACQRDNPEQPVRDIFEKAAPMVGRRACRNRASPDFAREDGLKFDYRQARDEDTGGRVQHDLLNDGPTLIPDDRTSRRR
jgi:hypothetical protein